MKLHTPEYGVQQRKQTTSQNYFKDLLVDIKNVPKYHYTVLSIHRYNSGFRMAEAYPSDHKVKGGAGYLSITKILTL